VRDIWIARLYISSRTAEKISQKHRISPNEIRDAVVCVEDLEFDWDFHLERGWRALVTTTIRNRPVIVVLYETGDPLGDSWNLGSVYFVGR
jgi:hypothetical protein